MSTAIERARRLASELDNLAHKDVEQHRYSERVACAVGAYLVRHVSDSTLLHAVKAAESQVEKL